MPHSAFNEHSRLVDEVGRALAEEILAGELRPGDRLTVLPLAERFRMSQSTIREALLILERRGLVTTRPRHGTFVTRLSEQEAIDLCRTRALIEAYAITLGIEQISDALLAELDCRVSGMRKCVLPKNLPQLIQLDLEFHQFIAELSASSMLLEMWSSLNGRVGALIMRSVEEKQLNTAEVADYHAEVVAVLATRDPDAAQRAIAHHYLRNQAMAQLHTGAVVAAIEATVAAS